MSAAQALEAKAATPGGGAIAASAAIDASFLPSRSAAMLEDDWRDLAQNAAEPNPFFAPPLLIPALRHFANDSVRLAVLRDRDGRLVGLAPFRAEFGYLRLPVPYLATWMHPHCFFGAPLIRKGVEAAAMAALFDLADGEGAFLRLRHLDARGPIAGAATRAAAGRRLAQSARRERAFLPGGYDASALLAAALSAKKRKELRRLRARLEEEGAVEFDTLGRRQDLSAWIADFLFLEASGWKGGEGTALSSNANSRAFFEAAAARAFDAGSLDFHRLTLSGRPIAMIVNFIDRGAGYSFKIAYDEAYARFSPGVMLEIGMMHALEGRGGLAFMDSCAAPDHPMINSLWRERRVICALNVSGGRRRSRALFQLLTRLERASEEIRAAAARGRKLKSGDDDDDL